MESLIFTALMVASDMATGVARRRSLHGERQRCEDARLLLHSVGGQSGGDRLLHKAAAHRLAAHAPGALHRVRAALSECLLASSDNQG